MLILDIEKDAAEIEEYFAKAVFVDTMTSSCGNCGLGASYESFNHDQVYGYVQDARNRDNGCGTRWEYITSHRIDFGPKELEECRPDLIYIGYQYTQTGENEFDSKFVVQEEGDNLDDLKKVIRN
jgi:hypothetical protein